MNGWSFISGMVRQTSQPVLSMRAAIWPHGWSKNQHILIGGVISSSTASGNPAHGAFSLVLFQTSSAICRHCVASVSL